jgi:hypothetical protein
MHGLKAAALIIFATAVFASAGAVPALAGGYETQAVAETGAQELRWDAIAAEGERFQKQRHRKTDKRSNKAKNFMAMAIAARQAR